MCAYCVLKLEMQVQLLRSEVFQASGFRPPPDDLNVARMS